jgi:putative membrane protein
MRMSPDDRARVGAAVKAAEQTTDGEIVVIAAESSDAYHDVALHWAVLAMLLALALMAAFPDFYLRWLDWLAGGWTIAWTPRHMLTAALIMAAGKFIAVRLLLAWTPLRMAMTPRATKARRVRRRAIALFRVGIEQQTASRTGVLLYLSLAEHRAEIVADAAVHAKVAPEIWGAAMAGLIEALRDGRAADGLVRAVAEVGAVLAAHFPNSGTDPAELPDRLIML